MGPWKSFFSFKVAFSFFPQSITFNIICSMIMVKGKYCPSNAMYPTPVSLPRWQTNLRETMARDFRFTTGCTSVRSQMLEDRAKLPPPPSMRCCAPEYNRRQSFTSAMAYAPCLRPPEVSLAEEPVFVPRKPPAASARDEDDAGGIEFSVVPDHAFPTACTATSGKFGLSYEGWFGSQCPLRSNWKDEVFWWMVHVCFAKLVLSMVINVRYVTQRYQILNTTCIWQLK